MSIAARGLGNFAAGNYRRLNNSAPLFELTSVFLATDDISLNKAVLNSISIFSTKKIGYFTQHIRNNIPSLIEKLQRALDTTELQGGVLQIAKNLGWQDQLHLDSKPSAAVSIGSSVDSTSIVESTELHESDVVRLGEIEIANPNTAQILAVAESSSMLASTESSADEGKNDIQREPRMAPSLAKQGVFSGASNKGGMHGQVPVNASLALNGEVKTDVSGHHNITCCNIS